MSQQQPPQPPQPPQQAQQPQEPPQPAPPQPEPARPGGELAEPDAGPGPESTPGPEGRFTLRSRTGGVWVVLVATAVVLILLLVFVLQNQQRVRISFLAAEGSLPLGVALLFATIAGVLIVAIPGTGRILQLRRAARRRQR